MKRLTTGLLAFMMLTTMVQAADVDWTGFYAGLNAGYGVGRTHAGYRDPLLQSYRVDSKPSGWLGGAQIGANRQLSDGVVLGLEADAEGAGLFDRVYDTASDDLRDRPGNSIKTRLDFATTVRARVGYAVGRFLPYLTAGGAGGHAEVSATDGPISESKFLLGWTVGGGLEYALSAHWSLRTEYLHIDLGEHTWFKDELWAARSHLTGDAVRLGANYRF